MWFRNIQAYRITSGNITPDSLEEALSQHALQPCMQMELQSRGWLTPRDEQPNFVHAYGQHWLIAFGVEKKLLPAAVINQHAKNRIVQIEQMQGYKAGKKQVRDTQPNEKDLKGRGKHLGSIVKTPARCHLLALYLPCSISSLPARVQRGVS